jgi:hypothetical protein
MHHPGEQQRWSRAARLPSSLLVLILLLVPLAAAALPAYSVTDCCSGSSLPALDTRTSKASSDPAQSALMCNYASISQTSTGAMGRSVILLLGTAGSAAGAQQSYDERAQAVTAEYNQMTEDQKNNLFQYSPPGPDRFSRIFTRTTPELGKEYAGERWVVYKSNTIAIIAADSTKSGSPQAAFAMLDSAETCAKRIIDRYPQAGPGTAATHAAAPSATSRPYVVPGSSGSPGVMMTYMNPGPYDPYRDDPAVPSSPYEGSTTDPDPGGSSGGSAALGAVVLLGGGAAVVYAGSKILGAGATKAAGGAAIPGTGPVSGGERSAAEVVAAGTTGPTQLEQIAMQTGQDTVDRTGEAPLPEDATGRISVTPPASLSSIGGNPDPISGVSDGGAGQRAPEGTGFKITDQAALEPAEKPPVARPAPEITSSETTTGNLEEELAAQQQLIDLRGRVDNILKEKIAEGYTVINPDWIRIWHRTILGGRLFTVVPSIYDATEYFGLQAPRGRCGEFARWGQKWIREDATKIFGEGTYVDQIALNPDGWSNHAATQITTPQGQKYIVDFWEGTHKGTAQIYSEAEWMAKWRDKLGQNVPQYRNTLERELEMMIRKHGEENGLEIFRANYTANVPQTEAVVNGYKKHPWFRL